jgi:uncharacterized protein
VYGLSVEKLKAYVRRDHVGRRRAEYRGQPDPSFLTYGPRTRRDFLRLKHHG